VAGAVWWVLQLGTKLKIDDLQSADGGIQKLPKVTVEGRIEEAEMAKGNRRPRRVMCARNNARKAPGNG